MSWEELYRDYISDKRCRMSAFLSKKVKLYQRDPAMDRYLFNHTQTLNMSSDSRYHKDIWMRRSQWNRIANKTAIYHRDPMVFTQNFIRKVFKNFENEAVDQIGNKPMQNQTEDDMQVPNPSHLIGGYHAAGLHHLSLLMNDTIAAFKIKTSYSDTMAYMQSKFVTSMSSSATCNGLFNNADRVEGGRLYDTFVLYETRI